MLNWIKVVLLIVRWTRGNIKIIKLDTEPWKLTKTKLEHMVYTLQEVTEKADGSKIQVTNVSISTTIHTIILRYSPKINSWKFMYWASKEKYLTFFKSTNPNRNRYFRSVILWIGKSNNNLTWASDGFLFFIICGNIIGWKHIESIGISFKT